MSYNTFYHGVFLRTHKTGTNYLFLQLFRIDTKIAAIVDNDVEEAFVQWFMEFVEKDTSNLAQIRLDSEEFNMNQILKRWLAGTYDGRTIDVSKAEDPT